jgi:murein L,D-transpeptidase YafK
MPWLISIRHSVKAVLILLLALLVVAAIYALWPRGEVPGSPLPNGDPSSTTPAHANSPETTRRPLAPGLLARLRNLLPDMSPSSDPPDPAEDSVDSSLPGPERARAAADRVRPALTRDLGEKGLRLGDSVFLRAFKDEKVLEVWMQRRDSGKYDLFRTYPIAAASGTLGPKLAEGDGQVPEGFYHAGNSSLKPDSKFHLAINIGYPNAFDRAHKRTGSFIMIHGSNASIGCLAMTDPKIEEIYTLTAAALEKGQPYVRIHVFPFRMSEARLAAESSHPWIDFWQNLKEGYDWFEKHGLPPDTRVVDQRYQFHPDR